MKRIEDFYIWRGLVKVLRFLLAFVSAATVLAIVFGVLMRYVFHASLFGVEDLILLLAMWLYFLGGVYGSYMDNHITADVLSNYLKSPVARRVQRILVTGLCLIISLILSQWGIQYVVWSLGVGGASTALHIPMILFRFPLCLGFVLMSVYNLYHFINALINRQPNGGEAA